MKFKVFFKIIVGEIIVKIPVQMPYGQRRQLEEARPAHEVVELPVVDAAPLDLGEGDRNEFRQIGEKGTPWHFWEYKSRFKGVPNKSLSKRNIKSRSDPISADPICPFPNDHRTRVKKILLRGPNLKKQEHKYH